MENIITGNTDNNLEYRFATTIVANSEKNTVEGTAILFDHASEVMLERGKTFREIISRSAATEEWLKTQTIFMRYQHSPNSILAKYSPTSERNSLHFNVDDRGVHYNFRAKKNDAWIVESLENGDLSECSFSFQLPANATSNEVQWSRSADGVAVKTIKKFAAIKDFSIVERGAYSNTSVTVRSYDAFIESEIKAKENKIEIQNTLDQDAEKKAEDFKVYYETLKKKYL